MENLSNIRKMDVDEYAEKIQKGQEKGENI